MSDVQIRKTLITAPLEPEGERALRSVSPVLAITRWPQDRKEQIPNELWREVEILYTSFATPLPSPAQVPRLRWVQLYSAGIDPIVDSPLFRSQVIFTSASGVHGINMAEHVFTMILAWFHQLPRVLEWQRARRWPSKEERSSLFVGEELNGKTLGIVGHGSVGRQVALLGHAFGMRVLAMRRGNEGRQLHSASSEFRETSVERFYTPDELHALLRDSDVIVIAAPLTPRTRGLFDVSAFRAMKPAAFLVNVARSEICDEAALVAALREKQIAGAALDVFHQEPLPPEHPLWQLPNVFITPHAAGLTPQYKRRAAMIFEDNLRRYLAGTPLLNLVNKDEGY